MKKKVVVTYALDKHIIERIANEAKECGISASAYLTLVLKGKAKLKL